MHGLSSIHISKAAICKYHENDSGLISYASGRVSGFTRTSGDNRSAATVPADTRS
jgi:hypothetical protein